MKWGLIRKSGSEAAVRDFRRDMDRLFDDFFNVSPVSLFESGWAPRVDVEEEKDAYLIRADIPGVDAKDLEVSVQDTVLTISGKRQSENRREEGRFVVSERSSGSFKRCITLPEGVQADGVKAEYKNGVLSLRLPRKAETKERIAVEVK